MSNDGKKEITLPFNLSVRDLAAQLNASPVQVIKILMSNGVMASINQQVDFDTPRSSRLNWALPRSCKKKRSRLKKPARFLSGGASSWTKTPLNSKIALLSLPF
jgi:hypothetical protein